MTLMQRLQHRLDAPRCARCYQLIHLALATTAGAGPHFHPACAQVVAAAAGARVVTVARRVA